MPPSLKIKIVINFLLIITIFHLSHLESFYLNNKVFWDMPEIKRMPIESEMKQIYKHTPQAKEIDHFETVSPQYCVSIGWVSYSKTGW